MSQQQKWPHIKVCPKCGHDTFRVAKSWWGREKYLQTAPNEYRRETVDEKQEEYLLIECDKCGEEWHDVNEIYRLPPANESGGN